jgi:hypothetical protein
MLSPPCLFAKYGDFSASDNGYLKSVSAFGAFALGVHPQKSGAKHHNSQTFAIFAPIIYKT